MKIILVFLSLVVTTTIIYPQDGNICNDYDGCYEGNVCREYQGCYTSTGTFPDTAAEEEYFTGYPVPSYLQDYPDYEDYTESLKEENQRLINCLMLDICI